MPHEKPDWTQFIVNAAVSATVGAVVAHFFREHGEKGKSEREEEQRRADAQRAQYLREQQAQVEQLLRGGRGRSPFAAQPSPMTPGLPFTGAQPAPFPGFPQAPMHQAPMHPWMGTPAPSMSAHHMPYAFQQPVPSFAAMPSLPSRSIFSEEE